MEELGTFIFDDENSVQQLCFLFKLASMFPASTSAQTPRALHYTYIREDFSTYLLNPDMISFLEENNQTISEKLREDLGVGRGWH